MATAGANDVACNLVQAGTLELKQADLHPVYTSLVTLSQEKIIVVDWNARKVRLHSLQDGRLLAVYSTESRPIDICVCNDETKMAVCLSSGRIEILSVKFTNQTEITRMKSLDVWKCFDGCVGVKYLNEKLVVSGWKKDNVCWGVVSITDGHIKTIHTVCKRGNHGWSFLCTNNNDMVFISCWTENPDVTGVYGYINSRREFLYRNKDLNSPRDVTMDRRHVYVCNAYPPCIHEMTESGQPLTIHTQGIQPSSLLWAIHWNQQDGLLYVTSYKSNVITRFRPEYSDHQDPFIPAEVLKMDKRSLNMYKEALRGGKEKVYNIRVMVVGQYGVGKSTLTKRLLGKDVNTSERKSTEGIDVHIECSKVALSSGEWTAQEKIILEHSSVQISSSTNGPIMQLGQDVGERTFGKIFSAFIAQQIEDAEQYSRLQRLVKFLNERTQKQESKSEQERQIESDGQVVSEGHNNGHPQHDQPVSAVPDTNQEVEPTTSQPADSAIARMGPEASSEREAKENKKDTMMEILQLVNENSGNLEKSTIEYATLAMWDFAGQYVFYTTHQTFLTSRAIYLLVIDLSQHITDLIKDDECFLDSEGIKLRTVYDLIMIWLNSIHSCTPSSQPGIPYVILVGTHVDKIPENCRQRVIDEYFIHICEMLNNKPAALHLMDSIAIDNTHYDPKLEELKKRIFDLAKQQPHWGEEHPARWLPLEQAIMTLKSSGVKVAPLSLIEEINRSQSVRIENRDELDLFLRFHHEMGTILYFSIEGLREKILLDPQWLIDAQKSLITAGTFINKTPAIVSKWSEFRKSGKLTHELIDAVWSKEKNPEFHDNKDHIIHLMEKLNIIARPMTYDQEGKEVKVESYFLAPCMLSDAAPREIISPKPKPETESSSVLCYVFMEQFLPAPIFHRLLAACVAHWPVAKNNSEYLIYCGCCVFHLDLHHRMTMFFGEHVIFVRVIRMGTSGKTLSSTLKCIEVKEFITMTLSKIIGNLEQSLRFELCIQCPESDGYNINSLISVADLQGNVDVPCHSHAESHVIMSCDLLKYWFHEEVKDQEGQDQEDVDAPITQEHINHARLCNALTTVGSDALRKILLSQVPASHTDIYQAILAKQAKLTRMNNDQHQLVFPDPKGRYTGTVDQFDISLLYTLIRNISAVSAPSNGWGNAPADHPRDTTLGASVERIRLLRNSISGHSVDGKISQKEFEDYWKMIYDVLNEIENVIGNHGYLEQLEKRRNQIITPHEACELRKIFKEYEKQVEAGVDDISSTLKTALSKLEGLRGYKN